MELIDGVALVIIGLGFGIYIVVIIDDIIKWTEKKWG